MMVRKGYVIRCEAIVEMTKLYAGDSGMSLIQAKLNIKFLKRMIDPPEKRREGLVLRHTDKKDA